MLVNQFSFVHRSFIDRRSSITPRLDFDAEQIFSRPCSQYPHQPERPTPNRKNSEQDASLPLKPMEYRFSEPQEDITLVSKSKKRGGINLRVRPFPNRAVTVLT
jgi:hypothetical protein